MNDDMVRGELQEKLKELRGLFEGLNRDLKLLFVSNLIGAFGDGLYAYLLPVYIQTVLHADPADVGFLYTVLTLSAALTPILGGYLAERYDWKKIMIFAWILWFPIPVILSLATDWTMLFPAMFLYGCFISGPSTTAYIASTARKDRINSAFTMISSAWWMGCIFSPGIGGYLATEIGMKAVFYMALVFYVLATLILFFIRSQKVRKDEKNLRIESGDTCVNRRAIIGWALFFASIMFFNVLMRPFVPTFLKDIYRFNEFWIGVLGSFTFTGSAILGMLIGRIGDKFGNKIAVSICLVFTAFSLTAFQFTSDLMLLAVIFLFMGTNYTPWALMNATISSLSPESLRGRWIAVSQTASMSAAFFAPYLGGVLYEMSPTYPFLATTIGSLILLALLSLHSSYVKFQQKS